VKAGTKNALVLASGMYRDTCEAANVYYCLRIDFVLLADDRHSGCDGVPLPAHHLRCAHYICHISLSLHTRSL
jgi:hypothetical protein